MDNQQFWQLIDTARRAAADPSDSDAIAGHASTLLAAHPPASIIEADHVISDLLAVSYLNPLWAAAYTINGGCSDDGFDYFRGWLIIQGEEVFARVIADPEALADLPVVRAAAAEQEELECEDALTIAAQAHRIATGEQLPADDYKILAPDLDPAWDFDFDDSEEMTRRLPRLAALYLS